GDIHRLSDRPNVAVIAVGGSNVRTRDDTAAALPLLLNRETAVVLMDRRGNGASTGEYSVPNTANTAWQIPRFGADVAAVARYLKAIGYRRVVVVGTSMGGWVSVSAAARAREIDAVVCISGGASSVGVSDDFDRSIHNGLSMDEAVTMARRYH